MLKKAFLKGRLKIQQQGAIPYPSDGRLLQQTLQFAENRLQPLAVQVFLHGGCGKCRNLGRRRTCIGHLQSDSGEIWQYENVL